MAWPSLLATSGVPDFRPSSWEGSAGTSVSSGLIVYTLALMQSFQVAPGQFGVLERLGLKQASVSQKLVTCFLSAALSACRHGIKRLG